MRYHEIVSLNEVDSDDLGIQDIGQDKTQVQTLDDNVKPKLTLKSINRLKKMRATRRLEMSREENLLGAMYGTPANDEEA